MIFHQGVVHQYQGSMCINASKSLIQFVTLDNCKIKYILNQCVKCSSEQDCIWSRTGSEYMGPANVSQSQMECLPWEYQSADLMLTDHDGQSDNKCRNPSNQLERFPYCYSKSLNNTFGEVEVCNIPYCGNFFTRNVYIYTIKIV